MILTGVYDNILNQFFDKLKYRYHKTKYHNLKSLSRIFFFEGRTGFVPHTRTHKTQALNLF